jgi:hypothetical protein
MVPFYWNIVTVIRLQAVQFDLNKKEILTRLTRVVVK